MTWPTNEGKKFPPEPLTVDEVHRLLDAASSRSNGGIRTRALIAVMYGAGLRVAETLALYPRDVDLDTGTVHVREGKNRKDRLVGIDPFAAMLVRVWLDRRSTLGLNGRHPLFATFKAGHEHGQRLTDVYVRLVLRRLATKAGIERRVHPHGLRHSLASDMADRGYVLQDIQDQLGHEKTSTTDRYIRRIRPTGLIDAMRQRDWSRPS